MSELGGSVGRIGVNNARAGMHHSLSTPAGVDGGSRTPPATPQKGGKMLAVRIQMLDDSVTLFQIQSKALGKVLFEQVCRQLHLLEADYFGLEYQEPSGTKYWLDLEKPVCRQVGLSLVEPILRFCVKFYTPDPSQLEEEFTRYLFCLQIKRDLAQGVIQCNDNTAALMASYIVQAECGDYVSEDYPDHTYLSSYRFVPQQEATMERRIMENHKKHAGQSPAAADLNLLETARRCELYGMKMHSAKDHEGVPLNLAVAHMGIVVFQHTTKINTFSWAKIRKISFKRKKFLVKLHPEGYGYYKDTVEFFFEGRNECKNFWKKCVENHGFFRCSAVKRIPRHKTRVLSRGSSFRYSGKTQKQIVEFVRDNYMKRQTFQRSQSFRHSSNLLATHPPSASVSVNASVSAHPLLPLADPVESASQVQLWGSMPAPVSLTTTVVCPLPSSRTVSTAPASPQGVTAAVVEPLRHIQMTNSPSPPLTTRSGSPVTSATWSPPGEPLQSQQRALSPPAAVVQGHQRVDEVTSIHSPCKPSGQTHNLLITPHNITHPIHTGMYSVSCPVVTHNASHSCTTPSSTTLIPSVATVLSSDLYLSQQTPIRIHDSSTRNSYSLPRNAELGCEHDATFWDRYNQTLSLNNISDARSLAERVMQKRHQSSERLEYELSNSNIYSALQYTTYVVFPKRQIWQRSASCRELYDFSFEETGQAKRRHQSRNKKRGVKHSIDRHFLSFDRVDSPITRYNDSHGIVYSSKNNSMEMSQDFILPEFKVYSSSYPGTACVSTEEACHQFELSNSHDDVSHASYELLERSDEDSFFRVRRSRSDAHTRSCSLDSGNYLPSDDSVSESECKYRSALDVKYHSETDGHTDIFLMDDPRDLPREKMSVKSDGSFYKDIKKSLGSRTSSQESKSDFYDSKMSKSSQDFSNKSRDSLYHTDSKKSHDTIKSKSSDHSGFNSRASSQESKSDFFEEIVPKNEKTPEKSKSKKSDVSRNSSLESKSDYYDAKMSQLSLDNKTFSAVKMNNEFSQQDYKYCKQKVKSHDSLLSELKANVKTFYDSKNSYSTIPSNGRNKESSHVHSISLQNVETEQHMRTYASHKKSDLESPDVSKKGKENETKKRKTSTTHIWPESIAGICTEITDTRTQKTHSYRKRSPENENIFSFDKEKIESLTGTSTSDKENGNETVKPDRTRSSPEYVIQRGALQSEFDKQNVDSPNSKTSLKDTRKEDLIAKTHFDEYNPKIILDAIPSNPLLPLTYTHPTVERTKSDPNSLANRPRMGSNSRRHVLMHQKSIDLTPADSSDEEYIYRQIPSAPPVCKTHGHFDLPKTPYTIPSDLPKTFELPKSYFKDFDERKYPFDKNYKVDKKDLLQIEIPYVLHKRHVMNGTASSPSDPATRNVKSKPRSPKSPKGGDTKCFPILSDPKVNAIGRKNDTMSMDITDKTEKGKAILDLEEEPKGFLFTQNIDLSKIDPVTLEVDKAASVVHHIASPKRDITKTMDPILLEALNTKLSQIESDSATSSKTDSFHRERKKYLPPIENKIKNCDHFVPKVIQVIKNDLTVVEPKRVIKSRMHPNKKVIKTKTKAKIRITSFSSDDESLDSDDVFGSAEATPTRLEFSPPQSRKEIEPILQLEYDKITSGVWTRGQTMSSTEIEGSPPQCRRLVELENRYNPTALDPAYGAQSELRRISERSISIPSSEDDFALHAQDKVDESTHGYHMTENIPSPILESCEFLRTDDEIYETCPEDPREAYCDFAYTLITKNVTNVSTAAPESDSLLNMKPVTDTKRISSKTKHIEELQDLPLILHRQRQTPFLFAHARLNLSEGSVFASLQRQKATQESPTSGRRAKSLDAPVIALHRLPPMNAFSSKDDTVDFNEEGEILEEKSIEIVSLEIGSGNKFENKLVGDEILKSVKLENDEMELLDKLCLVKQVRPTVVIKTKSSNSSQKLKLDLKKHHNRNLENDLQIKSNKKSSPTGVKYVLENEKVSSPRKMSPTGYASKPTLTKKTTISSQKSLPNNEKYEIKLTKSQDKTLTTQKSLPTESKGMFSKDSPDSLLVPEMARTKSQEIEQIKRANSKERSKSIEKFEMKRVYSKERSKSQEESEADIAKRKAKQQQLYESAIKQTITMISPVKDFVPTFPTPEDKISVTTDGENIIIETDIRSKVEDHVLIAKSPKKLDLSSVKLCRSFDESKPADKIHKLSRSFDDRASNSFEESSKVEPPVHLTEDFNKSPGKLSRNRELKQQIEGTVVHKKVDIKSRSLEQHTERAEMGLKSKSLENYDIETSPDSDSNLRQKVVTVDVHQYQKESSDNELENGEHQQRSSVDSDKSTEEVILKGTSLDVWFTMDCGTQLEDKVLPNVQTTVKGDTSYDQSHVYVDLGETDMQAVISERRNLDLLKRQSLKSDEDSDHTAYMTETCSEDKPRIIKTLRKVLSEDESLTEVSDIKMSDDSSAFVVYKLDNGQDSDVCEQHEASIENDPNLLTVQRNESMRKLSIERSKSEDTGSWMTIDYEEYFGTDDLSLSDQFELPEADPKLETQATLDDININSDCNEFEVEKVSELDDEHYSNIIITPPQENSPVIETNSLPELSFQSEQKTPFIVADPKCSDRRKGDFLRLNIERSKSSDTSSSWTSGESPCRGLGERQDSSPCSSKGKGSMDDESSVSCSISRPLGISQDIDKFDMVEKIKCEQLRDSMLDGGDGHLPTVVECPRTKKPEHLPELIIIPAIIAPKKVSTPTLEKQCPVDFGSFSEADSFEANATDENRIGLDKIGKRAVEESDSSSSASTSQHIEKITKQMEPIHIKVSRNPKIELTLSADSNTESDHTNGIKFLRHKLLKSTDKSSLESKSSMDSKGSLSVESRGSFETESSSGSLGAAHRRGELAQKEQQSTWRPFLIESSGSSSLEEGWLPPDQDTYENYSLQRELYDFSSQRGIDEFQTFSSDNKVDNKDPEPNFHDDLNDFPTNFGYPSVTSGMGIGINPSDMLVGYSSTFALARTLSRISERSSNSEKSSMDDESTKVSSQSGSAHDESLISSDRQASLSSDPPSHTNIAYISDADRRTSAEMPDIPCDPGNADRIHQMYALAQSCEDPNAVKTGRFSITQVSEGDVDENPLDVPVLSAGSSQESDDWPLPEIPKVSYSNIDDESNDGYVTPRTVCPVPKTFSWRSKSMQSQDSENWPSPPSSALDTPIVESVEVFYTDAPERAMQVMVDSFTDTHNTHDQSKDSDGSDNNFTLNEDEDVAEEDIVKETAAKVKSGLSMHMESLSQTSENGQCQSHSPITAKVLPYEETGYLMPTDSNQESCLNRDMLQFEHSAGCLGTTISSTGCLRSTFDAATCSGSTNKKQPASVGLLDAKFSDKVIVEQPTRSPQNHSPVSVSEDCLFADDTDDVFGPGTVKIEISPDSDKASDGFMRPKYSHGSNNSDTSIDDMLSTFMEDTVKRNLEPRLSTGSCKKCSHSSHSEEETSSLGTDLDGTVRMGLQPKKCTHSSHSEDTSVGLSISEWSTGTNTVRQYANLSGSDSLSAVSNISATKSEKSTTNLTKSSEFSSSNLSSGFKSSESLSASRSRLSLENLPEDVRYDTLSSSDTLERINSGTKSDDTTLTLTEMAQTISDWSSSTSNTLIPQISESSSKLEDNFKYRQMKDDSRSSQSKKSGMRGEKSSPTERNGKSFRPTVHFNNSISPQLIPSEEIAKLKSPDAELDIEKSAQNANTKSTERPVKIPLKPNDKAPKLQTLQKMSERYQSQDVDNSFSDKLYSYEDKLSVRYQSQEFVPSSAADMFVSKGQYRPDPFDKPLVKHHSYDDKTLSKHQIREYKNARITSRSQSFHEHLLRAAEYQQLPEHQQLPPQTVDSVSAMKGPDRPGKLSKSTSYYSSSLSSESPPIQAQKPPRKASIPRSIHPRSPPSGNDTDSSLDFTQDPRSRVKGYRRKRQAPAKRTRLDKDRQAGLARQELESSECSEGYFPEIESGSSDMSKVDFAERLKYPDFDEEPEGYPEEYLDVDDKYPGMDEEVKGQYPGIDDYYPTYTSGFEGLDLSDNVDEMGFPRYDRLTSLHCPYSEPAPGPSYSNKTDKTGKTKKKQLKREESIACQGLEQDYHGVQYTPEESGSELKAGLSDDVCYSSEDSFAAGYNKPVINYTDTHSRYFTERNAYVVDPAYTDSEHSLDISEPFDLSTIPPPLFPGDNPDEVSDED